MLVAAAPYVVGAIGWGLYIMQAPHDFMLQFGGNAAERGLPLNDPMAILHSQVAVRFLYMFGMAPDTRGFSHIKILILAVYAAGVLGVVMNREIAQPTRHSQSAAGLRRDLAGDDCAGPRGAASLPDPLCAVDDLVDRGGGRVVVGPALCTAMGAGWRAGWCWCWFKWPPPDGA